MIRLVSIFIAVMLMLTVAVAMDSKVDPTPSHVTPNYSPANEITIETSWVLPSIGQFFGVGCKWTGSNLTLLCGDWQNYNVMTFSPGGTFIETLFPTSGLCDPNDHCYIASDSDIGADDSLMIGDYATFGGDLLDIFDGIAGGAPAHREWGVTAATVMGVAYSPEFDVVYFTNGYDTLVWGDLTSTTFTQQGTHVVDGVGGLAFIPAVSKANPPLLVTVSQNNYLSIYELNGTTGYFTTTVYDGWDTITIPTMDTPSGCDWDGGYLWVVDQADPDDLVYKLHLEELGDSSVIEPASLGSIKAQFQ